MMQQHERNKAVAMASLMFLILLSQNLIRGIRDSIIIHQIGAEIISFIKLFLEMPAGILFVVMYTLSCNRYKHEHIFRITVLVFLSIFALLGFVLIPYHLQLDPSSSLVTRYILLFPSLKWFFMMWQKWPLVLFYVLCELWPVVVFTLLYWQLAHKMTKIQEASRLYFWFNLVGQSNLLISGSVMIYCKKLADCLSPLLSHAHTSPIMIVLMGIVMVLGILILGLHRYIEQAILHQNLQATAATQPPLTFWESCKTVARSSYLGLICLLMMAYSMVIALVEGLWLHETRLLYHANHACFVTYQGHVLFWTGMVTLLCSLYGHLIMKKLKWMGTALITPIATGMVGLCFFLLIIGQSYDLLPQTLWNIPILSLIVTMGGLQHIFIKGTKYSLFDVTKEMAYMPLDQEMQTKGKAAVDVLGGKLGKSFGSITQVMAYTLFPSATPDQIAPFLMLLFAAICLVWIGAVKALSTRYHAYQQAAAER